MPIREDRLDRFIAKPSDIIITKSPTDVKREKEAAEKNDQPKKD
ncbi:hypothetical protein [Paenibacillus flagellatus]|nr:hypothetical protein [Paenibacillus flagellatus]